ncbi:hypothetical protein [Streptomyces malaysiensis]|uniref:hypothetical protein n=1 Tax=Streptomyces malaysiensis TaxID=92644 RepID=UPI000BFF21FE|nr:hypothetical protein [Streptomyces malaysiensis]ATL80250.1 hypothetical protein SMALA_0005 [Streptomyces malaysiensis]
MSRRSIPTAPQTRPDPRFETVYDPERGGHYPASQTPAPESSRPADSGGRDGQGTSTTG